MTKQGGGGTVVKPAASDSALQADGRAFVLAVHAAAQALKLYPVENATVQKAFDELHVAAERITGREDVIELHVAGEFLLLNGVRLRLRLADYAAFAFLRGRMVVHGIGEASLHPAATRDDYIALLTMLLADAPRAAPFEEFLQRLTEAVGDRIAIERVADQTAPVLDEESKQSAKRTYFESVHVAREVLTDVRLGRAVNVRRVKRAVQGIVDQVLKDETTMIGMTQLRDFDEYTFTHSVNVSIFSVILGQKLGLDKSQLYVLGLGALLHDIGKMRMDPEILNKPGKLSDEEWKHLREHPSEGLLQMFSMHGFGEAPYRAMLMAYEHHMKMDLTGYPTNRREREPTLFSRIIAVVDGFDAATSKRSYNARPVPPDKVLEEMRDEPMRGYDPLVVKALMNVTGVFPVGTLVILDTYELAVVVAPNSDPKKLHQPVVKIIADEMGMQRSTPEMADLSQVDPETGQLKRRIIKTTDPERYGIRVAQYFL